MTIWFINYDAIGLVSTSMTQKLGLQAMSMRLSIDLKYILRDFIT